MRRSKSEALPAPSPCLPLPTPGTKRPCEPRGASLKKRRAPARRARTTPEKGETAAETPARRTAQRTQHNAHSTVRCASTEAQEHEGGTRTQERREPPAAARHSSETKTAAAGRFFRMEFLCRKKTLHEAVEGALRPPKKKALRRIVCRIAQSTNQEKGGLHRNQSGLTREGARPVDFHEVPTSERFNRRLNIGLHVHSLQIPIPPKAPVSP